MLILSKTHNKTQEPIVYPSGKTIALLDRYVSIVSTLLRVSFYQRKPT